MKKKINFKFLEKKIFSLKKFFFENFKFPAYQINFFIVNNHITTCTHLNSFSEFPHIRHEDIGDGRWEIRRFFSGNPLKIDKSIKNQ